MSQPFKARRASTADAARQQGLLLLGGAHIHAYFWPFLPSFLSSSPFFPIPNSLFSAVMGSADSSG